MTMTHIQTVELASDTSNIFFLNVPQSFTDLKLEISARRDGTFEGGSIRLNDVASNSYNRVRLNGSSSSVGTTSSLSSSMLFVIPASDFTSNTFSSNSFYFSNYTSITDKSISLDGVQENNASNSDKEICAFLFETSSAITKISVNGDFVAGSTFSLYGVTAGGEGTVTTS